ncbi:hypothetical protein F4553_004379 [Allocatelliglobosispora scoriae]|uniref:Anti-sigma factor n=1 Tax=Allocatelliglobosispora scoriae TaxID=643052 RepID=A0A841BW75_9ACTN|nr:hypothetical protein [Allocatelliglobosispora scoriae]MBB5871000.1 hypothetical protein [Allocatelliglobosispora scoriae]
MKHDELELLADYVGGALDGTPEAAEVTRKIRDNAAWAEAHSQLTAALRLVDEQLTEVARTAEPMPDDVWSRLEAALGGPASIAEAPVEQPMAPDAKRPWIPPAPPPIPPMREPSRRWRWLAPLGVAASVLACFGIGSMVFQSKNAADDMSAEGAKSVTPDSALLAGSVLKLASGRDYTPATLAVLTDEQALAAAPRDFDNPAGGPLARLSAADALNACLQALTLITPGTPTAVDFAEYQGSAALIVVVMKAGGGKWVAVAGPQCGTGGADLKDQRSFD